ncbi:1,3-beta-galactosyl-N-acetylhexosamine phosphorylase [Corynebacterium choanae]|uniref:1,3-beta-galactosyl-N-acetylhexosamine phosphorylase n=1 Tax=Corynebacterium choanae TaxID=1862358 RepID=A0A3G6J6Q0_9CORY|nr:1,3-beta-galactosyl-N-acetylhexosamine phosphorylase [Corynebacterium choanae]AZA12598.1 1,3-beta-galactosyl-N-acetylhexosamine phosphorylase [Corynebacterium choanae]
MSQFPANRLTLPVQHGIDDILHKITDRLHADAWRNSDGTELPGEAHSADVAIYATYFPARGDQAHALAHPEETTRIYLMSHPVTAFASTLTIDIMDGYFAQQIAPDITCDLRRYWQVIDRTTGETITPDAWQVTSVPRTDAHDFPDDDPRSQQVTVTISDTQPTHEYTVNFLAWQLWDSTQMYNYITNGWHRDPTREKERPYDTRYPATHIHQREQLDQWLRDNPHVDVVRFTTFFYHFTLVFDETGKQRYVDWFGYTTTVSPAALEAFAAEYGYELVPEDFIDGGYYNSPFRPPRKRYRDWMEFTGRFVCDRIAELTDIVHQHGRTAMMFLGDNWIGTEPYGPNFANCGIDAVVGSVGSAATCRMISDIEHVSLTEGRFLPYFFPDVFNPDGDPVGEAWTSWRQARRAIMRHPLDRMGYGGYLDLALKTPGFVEVMEEIVTEFRAIADAGTAEDPATTGVTVAVINAWGKLRSWQTHMVAHALPYTFTDGYVGVLEALAGLPVDVRFISFDEVIESQGAVLADVDVLINVGAAGEAFSGGPAWDDPVLCELIRRFVAAGGGIVGVGEPTATTGYADRCFALCDVFGVDKERGFSLSTDRHWECVPPAATLGVDVSLLGELPDHGSMIVPVRDSVELLAVGDNRVLCASHRYGQGQAWYVHSLPYSPGRARLLLGVLHAAAGRPLGGCDLPLAADPAVDVAVYPAQQRMLVANSTDQPVTTTITGVGESLTLPAHGSRWLPYPAGK